MPFPFLQKTSLWNALSALGRTIETPKGIFYWAGRAKQEAEIDGTIGIAQDDDGTISHLPIAEQWAGEKIMNRIQKGKIFAYAPIEGLESLRKKWLACILAQHPLVLANATMPIVTNGITHSIALAARLLLEPGQILITAYKSWENYEHILSGVQGIKIATFPLFNGQGEFHTDAMIETCRNVAQTQKKIVLLLNFPHNQTGYMPSSRECKLLGEELKKLCRDFPQNSFTILLDDAYEGYVYDDASQKFSPLSEVFSAEPNLSVAKMDGISKVMLAYGYRIGFLTFFLNSLDGAPFSEDFQKGMSAETGAKIGGLIRGEISQVNHHGQVLADALMDEMPQVEAERAVVISQLKSRFDAMMQAISAGYKKFGREKIFADPCNGGFFAYFNLAPGIDPVVIAEKLMTEKRVGVVPSGQGLRVAFCGVPKEKVSKMVEAVFATACQ